MVNPIKAILAILLIGLLGISAAPVLAADNENLFTDLFTIDADYKDGVAPGSIVPVEITLENLDEKYDVEDITVKVTLYDGSDKIVKYRYDVNHVSQDNEKTETIDLELPVDLDEGDYKLVAEAKGEWEDAGNDAEAYFEDEFEVEKEDDSLAITDVDLNSNTLASGDSLDVAVTVLNNGKEDAENIKIKISVPKLDTEKSVTLLDEVRDGNEYTAYLALMLPEAEDGIYTLKVSAYNEFADASYEQDITIENAKVVEEITDVVVPTTVQEIPNGKKSIFSLDVANNENTPKTLTLIVGGTGDWATAKIDPATLELDAGESQTVQVYLTPKEAGEHSFTVYVKEAGKTISATEINTEVVGASTNTIYSLFILLVFVLISCFIYLRHKAGGFRVATYR